MKYRITPEEFDALDEGMQGHYAKNAKGDGYVLQVDGLDEAEGGKVKEFRDNNIKLQKSLKELEAKMAAYKDVDPAKFKELAEKAKRLEELEEKNHIDAGNLEEVVAKRTETMRKDYDGKLTALQKALKDTEEQMGKYKGNYRQVKTDTAVRSALQKAGAMRNGAEELLVTKARELFQLNDEDELVAEELYDEKGNALDLEGWAKRQVIEKPFLFEPAQGSGAGGGNRGGSRGANGKGDGKRVLTNPSAVDFGKNLEDIASGKTEVTLTE